MVKMDAPVHEGVDMISKHQARRNALSGSLSVLEGQMEHGTGLALLRSEKRADAEDFANKSGSVRASVKELSLTRLRNEDLAELMAGQQMDLRSGELSVTKDKVPAAAHRLGDYANIKPGNVPATEDKQVAVVSKDPTTNQKSKPSGFTPT